jgi:hypothetical protein
MSWKDAYLAIMNGKLAARAVLGDLAPPTESELAAAEDDLWEMMSDEDRKHVEDCIEAAKKRWDAWSREEVEAAWKLVQKDRTALKEGPDV